MITHTKPAIGDWPNTSVERSSKRAARTRSWALDWRLLILSAVVLVVLVPVAYFWHAYQIGRNASALLVLADQCEAREEWAKAAGNLHRYLQLKPAEVETIVRMAEDFYKGAKQPLQKARAVQLYARAIALAPDRDDLQSRQMVLRLEVGDHRAALEQAQKLLARSPDDAVALRVQALAMHRQWRLRRSVASEALLDAFRAAIDKNRDDVDLATGLAYFYRTELQPTKTQDRLELEKLADGVMDQLVAASNHPAKAYATRYLYRQQFNLADAAADLDRAIAADREKQTFAVWWLAGSRSQVAGDYDAAIKHFENAIAIDAADRRGYLGLGNAYASQDKDDQAAEAWRTGLAEASPDDVELELLIAAAEVRQEHWRQAEADLKKVEKQLAPMTGPQQAAWLGFVFLLRGEIAIGQKDFRGAIGPLKQSLALRQAGADSLRRAADVAQVLVGLGQCYGATNQWDQAARAYQRAADLVPSRPGPRLAAAASWEAAGRYDEAARQYEDALVLDGVRAGAFVAAANAECLRQLLLPRSRRDWQALENRLGRAREELRKEKSPEPPLLQVVQSEYDAERGLVDQAVERCLTIESTALASKDLARRLILDYERWQRTDDANRLLKQMSATENDQLDHLLLASELSLRRKQRDQAFRLITDALPGADGSTRRAIQYRLAVMYLADGKADRARPLLESLAEADKSDLRPLQLLAELSLQPGKGNSPDSYAGELQSQEGADGTTWRYYKARRLMLQAGEIGKNDPTAAAKLYQQAADLQQQIESLRPAWAPGFLLKALLTEARELRSGLKPAKANAARQAAAKATQEYVHAVRLGARNLPVYNALINLLLSQGLVNEAEAYLDQARELGPLPDNLAGIAMDLDVGHDNLGGAIDFARDRVAAEPDNATRHLQLGRLLVREAGSGESANQAKLAEAEQELKRARDLTPANTLGWAALLSLYTSHGQDAEARALLAEAEKTKALGDEDTPFFLAQGYAGLGDQQQAEMYYSAAIAAAPDRAAVQFASATYFLKRDEQLAEKCLRRTLELDPGHRLAAELLANLLAKRTGTEQEVDQLLSEGQIEPKDRRLHAVLLLRRGGHEYRRQAQQILEALVGNPSEVAPIDHLLLARIYEGNAGQAAAGDDSKSAEANMAAAREQLKVLVNREHPAPEHLAAYIDNLLRSGRAADVAGRLDELASLEPETSSVRTLALRLEYLKELENEPQIRPLIDSYVESRLKAVTDKPGQARVVQAAAELYSRYDLQEEAEQAFRRAVNLDVSAAAALVNWLIKLDRTSDAVQLCVELAQANSSPLPAMLLSNALAVGKPTEDDVQAADPVIERAMKDHGDDPNLLFAVSVKQLMDGNNEESIRLLRKVLKLQPRHLSAMNNLAFVLSMKPESRDEAAELMAQVLALAGGSAELVDSKGWVLMQQRKLTEAVEAFHDALTSSPADPRFHFHLALAYQLQGKLQEARDAFQTAQQNKLTSATLPPDERSALARLETALQ